MSHLYHSKDDGFVALPRSKYTKLGFCLLAALTLLVATLCYAGTDEPLVKDALTPQSTPEGTVKVLYANEGFFSARNSFSPAMMQRFRYCFTDSLIRHFESHNLDAAQWKEDHSSENLKLPVPEGPIFISNYEGADNFNVGATRIEGDSAEVTVRLSYRALGETTHWTDIAILRFVGGTWLLDDIHFDPESGNSYTLRKRLTLDE